MFVENGDETEGATEISVVGVSFDLLWLFLYLALFSCLCSWKSMRR